ncbi:MAG: ubiquinol-cytochrome c reductase iron-sulfur subunit [Planctomycetota bacterium]
MPDTESRPANMPPQPSRRSFVFGGALVGLFGLMAAAIGAMFRFMVPSVLYEPPTAFAIGRPESFSPHSITFLPEHRLFLFNRSEGYSALSSICPHLGCNVRRATGARGFECPCHGSTYDAVGNVTGGPAPKPLAWHPLSLSRKGDLVVDTGVKVSSDYVFVLTEREQRV